MKSYNRGWLLALWPLDGISRRFWLAVFSKPCWPNGRKPDPTVSSEVLQLPGKSAPAGIQDAKNGKLVDDCRPWDFSVANVGFSFLFFSSLYMSLLQDPAGCHVIFHCGRSPSALMDC